MAETRKAINLALQGGGAHGAFTWGVCDRLLEAQAVKLNAITATSAGAMNAAVLAYGMHLDDDQGARDKLDEYWEAISKLKNPFELPFTAPLPFVQDFTKQLGQQALSAATKTFSPYQLNPMNWNPLKDTLLEIVDFERLNACNKIKLFISATNVRTGKVKVFPTERVTADAVLASACLPQFFQAVEIEGEAYWDGGYMGNPSLWPLFYETDVSDLLVVHINPMQRADVPTTVPEIENRLNEITFNAALLKEMRAISFVQKLKREGWLKKQYERQLSDIRYHAIRADTLLDKFPLESKYDTDIHFLRELKDIGRRAADTWLDEHWGQVGHSDTINLRDEFETSGIDGPKG
ncbi:MAG: patatin-like phospholipase family protein [Pseudomonadota bacterium]